MAWGKAGSTTLGSANANLSVTGISTNIFYQSMNHVFATSGNVAMATSYNGDTASSSNRYAMRKNNNGTEDPLTGRDEIYLTSGDTEIFGIVYHLFVSGEEKLMIGQAVGKGSTGAPNQNQGVGKYVPTDLTDTMSSMNIEAQNSSNTYTSDSNLTVLGSDITPAGAIPAIDNVQDNSLFIEPSTAKRYWFNLGIEPKGTSGSGGNWAETSFNNSTIVNNESASGNVVTRTSGSGWNSYIRSNEYISPSTDGGEIYFTQSANTNISVGLEKSPFNPAPSATYTGKDYSFHTTSSSNNMYEHTSDYAGTAWASATNEYRITMDSAGLVKYYWRSGSSGAWTLERTSTVTASGDYYFTVSHSGTAGAITSYIKGTPDTWTINPTFEDDFSTYATQALADAVWATNDTARMRVNISTDVFDFTSTRNGSASTSYHTLSKTASNDKWLLRFRYNMSSSNNNDARLFIGLSSTTGNYGSTEDWLGIIIPSSSGHNLWAITDYNNAPTTIGSYSSFALNPVTGTNYYVELIRVSSTSFKLNLYSDSAYSALINSVTHTMLATVDGLSHLKIMNMNNDSAGYSMTGIIDDVLFYNGVSSL